MVKTRTQYFHTHSPGVLAYVRQELATDIPDPNYGQVSRDTGSAWLFQANPDIYDLSQAIRDKSVGDTDSWVVTRYREEMQAGDPILLWQGGDKAGIYAVAELVAEPTERPTGEFWPDKEQRPPVEWAVQFRYTEFLETPLAKARLLAHPVLKDLQVLRAPQGTNFKVTAGQWAALQEVLGHAANIPDRPQVWIEKTIVHGRPDRGHGDYALGEALWSPKQAKNGADIYRFMREAKPGDIVLHLVDNAAFSGVSRVAAPAEDFSGVPGTAWEGECYLIRLGEFQPLDPPLTRDTFFGPPYREQLIQLIDAGMRNVFFNREPSLNQGAYLTPAPPELVAVLDGAYRQVAGQSLVPAEWYELPPIPPASVDGDLVEEERREPRWHPDYSIEDCAQSTGLSEELLAQWVRAIQRKRQAILYGPPGTGKTFIAEHLARHFLSGGNGLLDLVQFHPAYGYEEFILGIRPVTDDGILTYEQQAGRFVEFCERAQGRQGCSVLIIDEINRANLAQVFGELMYLLEYRDRNVTLAGGRPFSVPQNVLILGTMNTADRSIALMDYALRRRFAFLRLDPEYEVLRAFLADQTFPTDTLITILQEVNATIGDPNYSLGVSFFLQDNLASKIQDIWAMEIEPYVEEYFFDQPERVRKFTWAMVADRFQP